MPKPAGRNPSLYAYRGTDPHHDRLPGIPAADLDLTGAPADVVAQVEAAHRLYEPVDAFVPDPAAGPAVHMAWHADEWHWTPVIDPPAPPAAAGRNADRED